MATHGEGKNFWHMAQKASLSLQIAYSNWQPPHNSTMTPPFNSIESDATDHGNYDIKIQP